MACKAKDELPFFLYTMVLKQKNVPKVFSDVDSVIDLFCSIIQSKCNCFETKYDVAFLRCLGELSNIGRKQIIRKHKSTSEIAATERKRREIYSRMDPEKNKNFIQIVLKSIGRKKNRLYQIRMKSTGQ